MFEKILLPLPSEYFPEHAANRAINLADKFRSKLIIDYIFEEQVIDKVNKVSSGAVTQCSLEEMAEEVKNVEVGGESSVVFERIEKMARNKNIEIRKLIHSGHLSDELLDCIQKHEIDLIVSEFHKDTLLKYRIFYQSPIPIWLEQNGKEINKIYGILTNLSPNIVVPGLAFTLVEKLEAPLHFYYVVDNSEPSEEQPDHALRNELFSEIKLKGKKLGLEINIEEVTSDISNFLNHTFKHEDNALVILGRFTKPGKMFTSVDKKIEVSKKLGANVLMVK